jgi:cell migration-inducing and hyaluronan-binding protein
MRIHNRLFLLALLVPACFAVQAQAPGSAAVKGGLWSDPSTWSGGAVPAAGDIVTIGEGMDMVLDVSPPALNGINLNGKLSFADDSDVELTTEWILVRGELNAGSESNPHTRNATITLTNNVPDENINGMGDRGILMVGGTLSLHGDRENAWTKLKETAEAGSTRIEVLDASEWRVGDEIVLASTDFNPRQAERRHIAAIRGDTITLDRPLDYMHFGEITFDVDERGEVGLLTRNIKVQASADAEDTYFGGHMMAMAGSRMNVAGIELTRMGQHLTLARYPIHWHINGDVEGQYIKNSAIHDTYNRCVTIHATDNLLVENNVTYNTVGHCFFMEDGIESGNRLVHNLGIQTKCHPTLPCVPTNLAAAGEPRTGTNGQASEDVLIPSDNTASTYWITNPDNTYIDNVAAGADSTGFWMSLAEHPTGAMEGTEISLNTWPRRTPFREFRGNVAHSNYDGFMFDRNNAPDGTFGVTGSSHTGLADPSDPNSEALPSMFEDLTAYKNRNGGIWGRGEMHVFRNVKFADNAMGFTHASGAFGRYEYTSKVVDSLFVGETENVGNPGTPEEIAYGRSLPKPSLPDFPIRGYEYYDYRHDVENTTFMNYEDNATRKTGAISNLLFSSFGVSTNNAFERLEFVDAKPVYFPPMEGNSKWASDNGGSASFKTAAYRDRDGSLGFGPDSYVLIHDGVNDSIAVDEQACEIKPSWNAAVCQGDIGRLTVGGVGGGGFGGFGGGGGFGGRGGPPPAAAGGGAAGPGAATGRGGPPGGGAPAGPGGGGFGGFGGGGPAQPPVVLSRNGEEYNLTGGTNVRAGTEITVTTERPEVALTLNEMDEGSWVIFELPGFTTAASGTELGSLDALREARESSYFKDQDALWVKLVSNGDSGTGAPGGGTSINVSR